MGYNMKRGAAPKFKELGSSPVKQNLNAAGTGYDSWGQPTGEKKKENVLKGTKQRTQKYYSRNWEWRKHNNPDALYKWTYGLFGEKGGYYRHLTHDKEGNKLVYEPISTNRSIKPIGGAGALEYLMPSTKGFSIYKGIRSLFTKPKVPKIDLSKAITQQNMNIVQKTISNNPYIIPTITAFTTAGLISEAIEGSTEKATTENSAILGDILSDEKVKEEAQYQLKVEKGDDMAGKEGSGFYQSLERQRNKFYKDYITKYGKTNRGTMVKNMRNKKSEYYNPEFDEIQGIINDIDFSITKNPSDTIPSMSKSQVWDGEKWVE